MPLISAQAEDDFPQIFSQDHSPAPRRSTRTKQPRSDSPSQMGAIRPSLPRPKSATTKTYSTKSRTMRQKPVSMPAAPIQTLSQPSRASKPMKQKKTAKKTHSKRGKPTFLQRTMILPTPPAAQGTTTESTLLLTSTTSLAQSPTTATVSSGRPSAEPLTDAMECTLDSDLELPTVHSPPPMATSPISSIQSTPPMAAQPRKQTTRAARLIRAMEKLDESFKELEEALRL